MRAGGAAAPVAALRSVPRPDGQARDSSRCLPPTLLSGGGGGLSRRPAALPARRGRVCRDVRPPKSSAATRGRCGIDRCGIDRGVDAPALPRQRRQRLPARAPARRARPRPRLAKRRDAVRRRRPARRPRVARDDRGAARRTAAGCASCSASTTRPKARSVHARPDQPHADLRGRAAPVRHSSAPTSAPPTSCARNASARSAARAAAGASSRAASASARDHPGRRCAPAADELRFCVRGDLCRRIRASHRRPRRADSAALCRGCSRCCCRRSRRWRCPGCARAIRAGHVGLPNCSRASRVRR